MNLERLAELFATLMLVTTILNAGSPFIKFAIRLYAIQSLALALYTLTVAHTSGVPQLYFSAGITIAFKGLLMPWLLLRTFEQVKSVKEFQPTVGLPSSVLISGSLTVLASMLAQMLIKTGVSLGSFVFSISLAMFFIGAMLMVTRKLLLSQILSLLIIENSIFLAASSVTYGMPLIVELGVLFDLLIGVLIASVLVLRIKRSFRDIAPDRLWEIKE